ncbi:MAG: 16S rRNA (guanine(966)-N(2))-methyltransferase RsmD [Chloroflexi bacterium]|mgnify:CR=1 FL=1|jgi:16S rRNA (guanine966-N2)-methyltransferase|nr:16S rRNA (guanine(966)-N(2))-methyltransferase RsmD [Chloroflexota bacterium]MBT7081403.1 16S rRNA (guanine(966)-N(2))-methyltransferase RsmD [Chloroflexota bacterium]MBT7290451.1 16S rRNA (guanine(966)-N(2))-methyltransferase RsmD [Chloroflexota bacterium]
MRVIAGKVKGHRLKYVSNTRLRPTSDIIKGAIFSCLDSMELDYARVLDLYAGTGALGIEALSRGADWVDFVERDPKACEIIKDNLVHTKLSEQAHIYRSTVKKTLSFLKGKYMLILMDPPYADTTTSDILQILADSPIVGEGSVIVAEHADKKPLQSVYGCFEQIKNLNHGDTNVSIYQYTAGGQS